MNEREIEAPSSAELALIAEMIDMLIAFIDPDEFAQLTPHGREAMDRWRKYRTEGWKP